MHAPCLTDFAPLALALLLALLRAVVGRAEVGGALISLGPFEMVRGLKNDRSEVPDWGRDGEGVKSFA